MKNLRIGGVTDKMRHLAGRFLLCPLCDKILGFDNRGFNAHLRTHIRSGEISEAEKTRLVYDSFPYVDNTRKK